MDLPSKIIKREASASLSFFFMKKINMMS